MFGQKTVITSIVHGPLTRDRQAEEAAVHISEAETDADNVVGSTGDIRDEDGNVAGLFSGAGAGILHTELGTFTGLQ